jgi:hypothetical protein
LRKVPLVLAALPLVLAPLTASPALAGDDSSAAGSGCPVPTVDTDYDVHQLTVHLSLPVSGCAAREHRIFDLDSTVTRMDNNGSHDGLDAGTTCGPFRSASDVGPGEPAPDDSCGLGVAVGHPAVEAAQYDIDITYPGASGERTVTDVVFCRSDGDGASCEDLGMTAERDAER